MTTRFLRRIDWRRWLIYTHRWLGIVGGLVFIMWFVSGVVMMYERMPRLTAEERLARLTPLAPALIRISAEAAARGAGLTPDRVRVGMLGDRPVYRLHADGLWTTMYADTGEVLRAVSEAEALTIASRLWPEHASTLSGAGRIVQPDQWTLDGGLPRFLPMQRVALGDALDTTVYVSERTGEPVMKTTARGRFWGFMGSVLHWTYFTPFRQQRELWRYSIIYAALVGCVMCLSGLVVGVWRFSPSKRFRLKRQTSHSPYAGLMWWHHYAGLLFGLFSFTWALSGALSLTPWDWAPSTNATDSQRTALTGGPLALASAGPAQLSDAFAVLSRELPVKELELAQFQGRAFALAYWAPTVPEARTANNPDVSAAFSSELGVPRRLAWLDAPSSGSFDRFPASAMSGAAHAAMPDDQVRDEVWLDRYDSYYYDRWRAKPLPVLRVRYADAEQTWLYLDPHNGSIALRHTTLSRVNRWMYNGLHSFDLPFLYFRRPAWDLVLVVLSLGGIALTATTLLPAWRRLRRHARRGMTPQ